MKQQQKRGPVSCLLPPETPGEETIQKAFQSRLLLLEEAQQQQVQHSSSLMLPLL